MIKDSSVQVEGQEKVCLDQWVAHYRAYAAKGRKRQLYSRSGEINVSQLGICIVKPDGTMIKSGDWEIPFTLQSISKSNRFYSRLFKSRYFLCIRTS